MPMRDGTGPRGMGPMTGRGFGPCNPAGSAGWFGFSRGRGCGRGWGFGRGFCRGWGFGPGFNYNLTPEAERDILMKQKEILENELELIKKQLNKE